MPSQIIAIKNIFFSTDSFNAEIDRIIMQQKALWLFDGENEYTQFFMAYPNFSQQGAAENIKLFCAARALKANTFKNLDETINYYFSKVDSPGKIFEQREYFIKYYRQFDFIYENLQKLLQEFNSKPKLKDYESIISEFDVIFSDRDVSKSYYKIRIRRIAKLTRIEIFWVYLNEIIAEFIKAVRYLVINSCSILEIGEDEFPKIFRSDKNMYIKLKMSENEINNFLGRNPETSLIGIHTSIIPALANFLKPHIENLNEQEISHLLFGKDIRKQAIFIGQQKQFIDIFWSLFYRNGPSLYLINNSKTELLSWMLKSIQYKKTPSAPTRSFTRGHINNTLLANQRNCKTPLLGIDDLLDSIIQSFNN